MEPLSLAVCVPSLRQGGAERVSVWLADALTQRGSAVTLVTKESRQRDFYESPRYARRVSLVDDMGAKGELDALVALFRTFRKIQPDLVLSFLPRTNVASTWAARAAGCRITVCERADPRSEPLSLVTSIARALSYPLANGIVLQSASASCWARRYVPFGRFDVIPNPVRPLKSPGSVSREKVILGMGRLTAQKRFDRLIRAFASFAREFPELRLRIVGDGPLRRSLRSLADATGFGSRIDIPGAVQAVELEYARATIFVLTSAFEGFPNVLLEAMSTGLPVVAMDCPTGPADIIQSGVDGLLVEAGNEAALGTAIRSLLLDRNLADQIGANAKEVRQRFAPEAVLDQWEFHISACLDGGSM